MEAQAQTAEIVGATQQAAEWYSGQAGIVAGTWAIIAIGMGILLWWLIKLLLKQKEDMTRQETAHLQALAELKASHREELAKAKVDALEEANEKVELAWKRVDQIYSSVQGLFAKSDATADKVAERLQKLTLVLATKGVLSND